jgi:hypothetical protein
VQENCREEAQVFQKAVYDGAQSWHGPWDGLVKCFNIEKME